MTRCEKVRKRALENGNGVCGEALVGNVPVLFYNGYRLMGLTGRFL